METNAVSTGLMRHVPETGLVLILGAPGSGKSCLAYGLLDTLAGQGKRTLIYGFPLEKAPLLPDSITPATTLEFPEDSVVLSDEAYIQWHSRSSMSERNRHMDLFAGLVRQKSILGIYVAQLSRKLDIGIVSAAQVLLIKRPSLLQWKLDRSELRGILQDARIAFNRLRDTDPRACTYVLADDFEDLVRDSNRPPSFWSDALSRPYAGIPLLADTQPGAGYPGMLCCLPECSQLATVVCACHGNSYCPLHLSDHVPSSGH